LFLKSLPHIKKYLLFLQIQKHPNNNFFPSLESKLWEKWRSRKSQGIYSR